MIRDREFYKTILRISLPAAFQSLVSFLVVVADDVMVSKLPNAVAAQAAVSQVNSITAFYTATLTGLVSGSSVLISQYWGKKDMARIRRIFSVVLWFCALVSLIFVALARLIPEPIIHLVIGAGEADVVALALEYFSIACWTYIPFAITTSLIGMLRSIEVVRITLVTTVMTLFINVGLNYVLIFGHLGFPALGVRGAAIATLVARIAEVCVVWLYTFRIQKKLEIRPRDLLCIDRMLGRDYARYGLPVGLTDMQWSLIGMLKAAIIGQMGASFMAATSIANNMATLGTLFTSALAGGACVVVGKAVGRGDYDTAREYSKTIQLLFFLIGLVMAALVFLLRVPFTRLYGSSADPEDRHLLPRELLRGHQPRRGRQPLRRDGGHDLRLAGRAAGDAARRVRVPLAAAGRVPVHADRPVLQVDHCVYPPARRQVDPQRHPRERGFLKT